ncbi:MAG: cation:proton antiporter, partial [Candidatus Binataceae bacterium]
MAISLALSIALLAGGLLGIPGARHQAAHILNGLDFNQVLLHGMLAFMLFAGAQSLNLNDLKHEKAPVVLLATVSVVVSTLVVGL